MNNIKAQFHSQFNSKLDLYLAWGSQCIENPLVLPWPLKPHHHNIITPSCANAPLMCQAGGRGEHLLDLLFAAEWSAMLLRPQGRRGCFGLDQGSDRARRILRSRKCWFGRGEWTLFLNTRQKHIWRCLRINGEFRLQVKAGIGPERCGRARHFISASCRLTGLLAASCRGYSSWITLREVCYFQL